MRENLDPGFVYRTTMHVMGDVPRWCDSEKHFEDRASSSPGRAPPPRDVPAQSPVWGSESAVAPRAALARTYDLAHLEIPSIGTSFCLKEPSMKSIRRGLP